MQDELIRIPRTEYPQRWEKVQAVMRERKLDIILAYSDDRATYGNAYARYYTDFQTHFEPVLVMFVPDREPLILTGPETDGYAGERAAVREIKVLAELAAEDEDYPFSKVETLKEIIRQYAGKEPERIGLAAKVYMGAELYEALLRAYPDAELVDTDQLLAPLRGIKSQSEIAVICRAYEIANAGMQAAIAAVRPGITERKIAAEAEYVMRKMGCEGYGIDPIVSSGPNAAHVLGRTTTRVIEENDIVVITLAPRYEGYHGACGRTVLVGNPGEKAEKAVKAMIRAQNLCAENLVPGNIGSRVEEMGRQVMKEAGYEKNFMYSGLHSVGVIEFEPPIFGPSSSTVIEKDMVISIDIPLFEADVSGMRMEDGYLITEAGARKLTDSPQWIQK